METQIVSRFELEGKEASLTLDAPDATPEEREALGRGLTKALRTLDAIERVKIRFLEENEKDEGPENGNDDGPKRKAYLENYRHVALVASGKGGVGKSTCTLNIALALKQLGKTVSILDADVYGPSLPLMMGQRGHKPRVVGNRIMPLSQFGVEYVSIGNMVSEGESIIWRGPMVHQALEQLIRDTQWPGGDFILVDMPPGTGDVALTLSQVTESSGAVIVCTPQDVALIDARRAMAMFDKVDVPVVGVVENMSGFLCPHCGKASDIFGKGGVRKDGESFGLNFLGSVPIQLEIRRGTDTGKPVMNDENAVAVHGYYLSIAERLIDSLEKIS